MTAYGDRNPDLGGLTQLYSTTHNRAVFVPVIVNEGLLSTVAFWMNGGGGGVGPQPLRALLYDADSRSLVAVSDEVVIPDEADPFVPLRIITFPIPGGVYWKGGKLLAGFWAGSPTEGSIVAGREVPQLLLINSNFQHPTDYKKGWTTTAPGSGTSVMTDIAEPLLNGGGVKVTLAGVTGSGTWIPVRADEPNALAHPEAMAGDVAGPSVRTLGFRVTVIVDTQVTNANAPLKLMLRGAKMGFTFTPILDVEVQAAQSAANLSTYPAGSVIELVGTADVPATSTWGIGVGLNVDVAAGAAGALRIGKVAMTFPAALSGGTEVPEWSDGSFPDEMWLGFPAYTTRSGRAGLVAMSYSFAPPSGQLYTQISSRPFMFVTTSGLAKDPDLPDEELAAFGWNSSQRLLAGPVESGSRVATSVEWHHTSVEDHTGAFALVREGGPLEELVGDVLRVTYGDKSVYVYVIDADDELDADLSLARRAFMQLANLASDDEQMTLEVVGSAQAG